MLQTMIFCIQRLRLAECVVVRSATKQQAFPGGKKGQLSLAKRRKVERAKQALDLAERSGAPNTGDQKGAEPPFLALPT